MMIKIMFQGLIQLNPPQIIHLQKAHSRKWGRGKQHKKYPIERSKDHFKELTDAVEKAHEYLVKDKSPYRFCVYEEEGKIFINLVILNEKGKIDSIKKKNIMNEEFTRWMEMIETGEGLLFDETV